MESLGEIKIDVLEFFNSRDHLKVQRNKESHLVILDKLTNTYNVKIELDDDRNYHHCDRLALFIHPEKGIVDHPTARDRYQDHDVVQANGGKIWELFIALSDIGPYFTYYWNIRTAIGAGDNRDCNVKFKEGKDEDDTFIVKQCDSIINLITESGFIHIDSEALQKNFDWVPKLNEEREGEVNLDHLLFGGY